jgi:hypothetical protein
MALTFYNFIYSSRNKALLFLPKIMELYLALA